MAAPALIIRQVIQVLDFMLKYDFTVMIWLPDFGALKFEQYRPLSIGRMVYNPHWNLLCKKDLDPHFSDGVNAPCELQTGSGFPDKSARREYSLTVPCLSSQTPTCQTEDISLPGDKDTFALNRSCW